jgi:hypothetical protein
VKEMFNPFLFIKTKRHDISSTGIASAGISDLAAGENHQFLFAMSVKDK